MPLSADGLFDEAVNHVIRLQANPGNPAALEALAGWRARSPAHEKAWAEIAEIHGMTGALLAAPREAGVSRRRALGLGVLGLGLAGGGAIFGPRMILAARADHLTSTAEIRDFDLPDGSRIRLGPDSAVALDFAPDFTPGAPGGGRRGVHLLAGMAWLEIAAAAAPGQDFILTCAGQAFSCDAAALTISEEAGQVSLALDRGSARVASGPETGLELSEGDLLSLDDSRRMIRRDAGAAYEASAWLSGKLVVSAEPVSVTVARIARWLPERVLIAAPGIGARLVSGVFSMDRPRDALLAAVSPHGAGLRQVSPWLLVVTTI